MSLSNKESVWRGRTQTCSQLLSKSLLKCSSRSLVDKKFVLKLDSAKKAPLVLMCYCMSCKREFLLQKEAWQYITGAVLTSTRFISTRLFLHHTEADHRLFSLKCSAVITVHRSCLGQAVTTAGSGSEMLPFPPALTSLVMKLSYKWPPHNIHKICKDEVLFSVWCFWK